MTVGGTVTVLTMGPPQAEEMMRDAYTMGADDAVILSDRKFAGADVLATSYTLMQGIQVLGGADLIICGRQTTDGDTAQVGPAIAEHLGIPHAAWVAEIVKADENTITLRDATPEDAAAVAELYNWYVTHSTATFQYDLCTEEFQRENIAYVQQRAPFLVAVNAAGKLCGFACAHPWHSRTAYAWDVELTVYCAHDCVGQGVGGRLYKALLDGVRQRGYCNAVALVTGQNKESCAFHKALGFKKIGVEPRTGYKFGQWLDLAYWWMDLRPGQEPPEPVRLGR